MLQWKEIISQCNVTNFRIYAGAWGPPKWMKTNNRLNGISLLKFQYYQTWADLHLKYLQLMKKAGINIWALGSANEVGGSFHSPIRSVGWLPDLLAKWVSNNLGPTIRNSEFKDVNIFVGDDQRVLLLYTEVSFPSAVMDEAKNVQHLGQYVDGFAFHWYLDPVDFFSNTETLYTIAAGRYLFVTESSLFYHDNRYGAEYISMGHWHRMSKYIDRMFENFKHWVDGWIDWNLVVNHDGGPTLHKNPLDAPIVINTMSGRGEEAYIEPSYYFLGHFSKFVLPDSVRIDVKTSSSSVDAIGFIRPDDIVVIIFYNS